MSLARTVSSLTRTLDLAGPWWLEGGGVLPSVRVAYRTWGGLSPAADNAVVVCHALTGSADADGWWTGMLGEGRAADPTRDFIVCSNLLGSCYGTTGPSSDRGDGTPWGPDFPALTIRDVVRVQGALLDALGVGRIRMVIGGSLGGMQVLEWGLTQPSRVDTLVPIACSGRHSAWCIGWSEAQRQAIMADPAWNGGRYHPGQPPAAGLAAARMVAMCTYRSRASLQQRHGRRVQPVGDGGEGTLFAVESYLRYQGWKLVERFDANTYLTLTRAMDSHDVAQGRGEYAEVLGSIRQPTLVVSIDTDVLYPPEEQRELADGIPGARLATLRSAHGHDGFLIEVDELSCLVVGFRRKTGTWGAVL